MALVNCLSGGYIFASVLRCADLLICHYCSKHIRSEGSSPETFKVKMEVESKLLK